MKKFRWSACTLLSLFRSRRSWEVTLCGYCEERDCVGGLIEFEDDARSEKRVGDFEAFRNLALCAAFVNAFVNRSDRSIEMLELHLVESNYVFRRFRSAISR